jgi:hypothetical protein
LLFFRKISPSISTELKKQKTKNPIDEIKGECGWMDVVDADIKTVDEKIPQPPPDFRSESMQLRSRVATGGPRLALRVSSLSLEPRPGVLHSSLSLSLSRKLHENYMQSAAVLRKLVQKKFGSQSKLAYISCLLACLQ